jgi:hypothetical protein
VRIKGLCFRGSLVSGYKVMDYNHEIISSDFMNQNPQWRFREMQPGEINVDPIEGEFFTTEAIGSITDALVRESIQNSLDAARGNEPVVVRFALFTKPNSGYDAGLINKRYIDGLSPHLRAKHAGLQDLPNPADSIDYLLIEDYGTRGLQGDISQYDDLNDDFKKNDFYYFWRNIGRTRKEATDLGRWGLGKTVFQAASRINSFFGLTIRNDDGRLLLMGQSVLKIHKVNGRRFAPYGYFGRFNGELALPVEEQSFIKQFSEHFSVDRVDKPGLSILVPFLDREIETGTFAQQFVISTVKHYFFPVLAGKLIVEIKHENKSYKLDANSLDNLLKKSRFSESRGMIGLIDLARWAIKQPENSYFKLAEPTPGKAPKLRDTVDPAQLIDLQQKFSESKRLAFYLPISIQRQNGKEILHTGFRVFLERNDNLEKAEDYFIRQGITLPEITSLKHKGIRAIVSITERDLSTFLGDAENPAHTEWERNSKKFKQKYKLGPTTLDYVKTSPREIVKLLTQPQKGRDENLLKHIFSLPDVQKDPLGKNEKEVSGEGENKKSTEPIVDVIGSHYIQLTPVKGGFRLTKRPKATKVPRYINIWLAYEVRSGNPFKKYTPLDFDLAKPPIEIQIRGAILLLKKENVIQIEVRKGNFQLTVTGFDMHRDLRIKTNP